MSTSLPERASLDQLRKQAKEIRKSGVYPTLAAAQFALAQSKGFASWPKLVFAVQQQAVQAAIRDGVPEVLAKLLAKAPRLAKAQYPDGSYPLHQAAENDDPEMVEMLVKAGAAFRPRYAKSTHTALSWAVTCWSPHAALKLVELGDQPDLFCAAGLGLLDHVKACWADGRLTPGASQTGSSRWDANGERLPAPPERAEDVISDALYMACRCGQLEVARWLLDHGADPNWRGFIDANCLAWAELSGNRELIDLIRSRGGSDETVDSEFGAPPKLFPIFIRAGWGFGRALADLITARPDLVEARAACGTPLHAAAKGGFAESAKILLAAGADRAARDPQGRTPADVAEAHGHAELASLLNG
ncbi:MAG TPA: ankyrin repeat domain-containing protein [Fimbriimonadaceae bacterium]|nr:ankyrin repeat domain-containing protein [Fimbriimonadaceae bacterium]